MILTIVSYLMIIFLVILIILDVLGINFLFKKKKFNIQDYIGIGIILVIIIWPQIQEGEAFGFSFKKELEKVEERVTEVEGSLEDIFSRYETEIFWSKDLNDINIFNFHFNAEKKSSHLDIKLKDFPVNNSVSLWFFGNLLSPNYYSIEDDVITINFDERWNEERVRSQANILEDYEFIVVQYIKK